jgi:hypothetical protein
VVSVHSVDLVSERQISSFVFLGFVYKVCVGRSERQISSFVFLGFVYKVCVGRSERQREAWLNFLHFERKRI